MSRTMTKACVLASALALTAQAGVVDARPLPQTAWIPTDATACDLTAWPSYRLNAPVVVRSAPDTQAAALGAIPTRSDQIDYPHSVRFQVREARPGWLKIADASDAYNHGETDADDRPLPVRTVYSGEGWIPADAAQFAIQSARGFARPDRSSERLLDLGDDWVTDMGRVAAIRACGPEGWVLVDYVVVRESVGGVPHELAADRVRTGTAWFQGVCEAEETTCDMASVDRE